MTPIPVQRGRHGIASSTSATLLLRLDLKTRTVQRDALAPGRDLILLFAQPKSIPAEPASGRHYTGMRLPIRQADVEGWR